MKIVKHCPTCNKVTDVKGEIKYGNLRIVTYVCGHSQTELGVSSANEDTLNITSLDGKRPFNFQLEGGRFLENSNGRALLADEMGIGKTIQALMFLVAHPECRPFVWVGKAGLRVQYMKECVRWGDLMVQVIDEGKNGVLLPGMDGYIIGVDSAWRIGYARDKKTKEMIPMAGRTLVEQLDKCKVKTVVLDECQSIKNDAAKRTKAIQDICRDKEHIIALSGTPIKNNAAEYFPILNILRPDKFPNRKQYIFGWCDTFDNGYGTKTGGLKHNKIKQFQEFTKDFILRRERKDVLPDLPSIFRQFSFCELGEVVEEAYIACMKEFQSEYAETGGSFSPQDGNILGYLSKMRHLTGLAKVDPICEWTEEFITTTDRKLAIFVHHKDVGETLKYKLTRMAKEWASEWGTDVAEITSDMDTWQRDAQIELWRGPNCRIAILSTLAAGEGLNLQFCSDCILAERQWNPANEEQAEARFPRPGQTADKINATYFTAVGTIDEFLSELVEQKRQIVGTTLGGEAAPWSESSVIKDLAKILSEKGGRKWGF